MSEDSKTVEREVVKPIKLRVNGAFKEIGVGETVQVTPENAEIFKDRLAEVGFAKTKAGRKLKAEAELEETKAELEETKALLEKSKASAQALHAELTALKGAKA